MARSMAKNSSQIGEVKGLLIDLSNEYCPSINILYHKPAEEGKGYLSVNLRPCYKQILRI